MNQVRLNAAIPQRPDQPSIVPAASVAAERQRNLRVDFLRGVAISCVLLLHFSLSFGLKNSPAGAVLPDWLLRALVINGNFGVTMFFAISGYLITSNSLRRWGQLSRIDARAFYAFRFARILPPLLLALLIIVILGCLEIPSFANTDGGKSLPASYFVVAVGSVLTFWHNVLMQSAGYFNYCLNVYWSLSVEEVFYLAMPVVCLTLRRTSLLVAACMAAIVVAPLYRQAHADNEIFYLYGYPACFDAIAMGCLAALLAHRCQLRGGWARAMRVACAVAIGAVYLNGIQGHEMLGFTLMGLASAGFLFASAQAGPAGFSASRGTASVRWLGRHSYEIYLFHVIVLGLMRNVTDKQHLSYAARLPWLLLFLALTALTAWLVARYVSEPANRALRRRYRHPGASRQGRSQVRSGILRK